MTRLVLGIETSCDETAAAVVEAGRIVHSSAIASQAALHAPYGGVFPEVASRQHVRDIAPIIRRAMDEAGAGWADLAGIAVTRGPGLAGALLVGANAAKGLAMATGLPLVGVDHLQGHLASNALHAGGRIITPELAAEGELPELPFPHLALIVSGGHTELVWVVSPDRHHRLGGTRDDAAGEALDKAARMLGLGYPGGPAIERAAAAGRADAFVFPVPRGLGLDFSFSGLKTAMLRHVEGLGAEPPVADLAAGFQDAVVRALVAGCERALEGRAARALAVAGGVAANGALRAALRARFPELPLWCPPPALCTDNAAMIAAAGWHRLALGEDDGLTFDVASGAAL